jgi:tartrate dehydrogenase/decarboxylase/D-malate dehydrogenase
MMLDHLGCPEAGAAVLRAIENTLQEGPKTPDLGGKAGTVDLGKAVAAAIQ